MPNRKSIVIDARLMGRKCIKSAVFGDADNLWEVLWYPNSGVQGGDYASLYLSCVVSLFRRCR